MKRPPGTATLLAYTDVADGELVCAAARFTEDRDPAESGASAGMCQCVYQDEGGLEQGRAQRGVWTLEDAGIVASRCRSVLNVG